MSDAMTFTDEQRALFSLLGKRGGPKGQQSLRDKFLAEIPTDLPEEERQQLAHQRYREHMAAIQRVRWAHWRARIAAVTTPKE